MQYNNCKATATWREGPKNLRQSLPREYLWLFWITINYRQTLDLHNSSYSSTSMNHTIHSCNSSSSIDLHNSGKSSCRRDLQNSCNNSSSIDLQNSNNINDRIDLHNSCNSSSSIDIHSSGNSNGHIDLHISCKSSSSIDLHNSCNSSSPTAQNYKSSGLIERSGWPLQM